MIFKICGNLLPELTHPRLADLCWKILQEIASPFNSKSFIIPLNSGPSNQ